MAHISVLLRAEVVERAKRRCEYCKTPQMIVIEVDGTYMRRFDQLPAISDATQTLLWLQNCGKAL